MIPVSIRSLNAASSTEDSPPVWRTRKFIMIAVGTGSALLLLVIGIIAALVGPSASTTTHLTSIMNDQKSNSHPINFTTKPESLRLFSYSRRSVMFAIGVTAIVAVVVIAAVVASFLLKSQPVEPVEDPNIHSEVKDETETSSGIFTTQNIAIGVASLLVVLIVGGVVISRVVVKRSKTNDKASAYHSGLSTVESKDDEHVLMEAIKEPDVSSDGKVVDMETTPDTETPDLPPIENVACRNLYEKLVEKYNAIYDLVFADYDAAKKQQYEDCFNRLTEIKNAYEKGRGQVKYTFDGKATGVQYMIAWMFFQGRIDNPNKIALILPRFIYSGRETYDVVNENTVHILCFNAQKIASSGCIDLLSSLDHSFGKFSAAFSVDPYNTIGKLFQLIHKSAFI